MMKIAVCDDDMRFAAELEEMVRREAADAGISVETEAYSDGDTLVADIEKSVTIHSRFDGTTNKAEL